jgi:Fur family transcriptional regulator, ferric uptake regulator
MNGIASGVAASNGTSLRPLAELPEDATPDSARLKNYTDALQRRGQYLTGPRLVVLRTLMARPGCATLSDILADVRRSVPGFSEATLYRTMKLLVEAEVVRERRFGGRTIWFEMNQGEGAHDRLVCNHCGKVVPFASAEFSRLRHAIARERGFELTSEPSVLFGTCCRCAAASVREHPQGTTK